MKKLKRVGVATTLVVLALAVGSCELLGRVGNFAWEAVEDLRVMAIEMVEDLPLERAEDLLDRAAALIRPVQQAASDFYMQLRGIEVTDVIDTVTDYAMVIFEDRNGDGEYSADEPFFIETNEDEGFRLDRDASIVGSIAIEGGELEFSAYNLDVTYGITTSQGIDITFSATAPGASQVILHHSQDGWLTDHVMEQDGDRFVVFLDDLSPGPFSYKFQIDDDVVWYPDPNEPGYFPNFWTFWDDENIDWNSALLLTNPAEIYDVTINLVDLYGDATDGVDGDFSISYGPVQAFWPFEDDAFVVGLHDNVDALPYAPVVAGKSATVHLTAGQYYAVVITDGRDPTVTGYMENRVYLYAHEELDGGSFNAHMTKMAQMDALYTARSVTVPTYDDTYRGFVVVNYAAEMSDASAATEQDPWNGTLNFSLTGLAAAKLPLTLGEVDDPFVYQILVADEDVPGAAELGLLDDAYNLDFTDLTYAPFPENAEYYGYSTWDDPPTTLNGFGLDPEIGIILGPPGGKFFIDYFGNGHLVNIPGIKTLTSGTHEGYITTEVVLP